jgi:hypothetical protein
MVSKIMKVEKQLVMILLCAFCSGCYTPKNWHLYSEQLIVTHAAHPWTNASERHSAIQELLRRGSSEETIVSVAVDSRTTEQDREDVIQEFLKRGVILEDEIDDIRKSSLKIGMSKGAVMLILGNPKRRNISSVVNGTEQWVYGSGSYYYFANGKLIDAQHF